MLELGELLIGLLDSLLLALDRSLADVLLVHRHVEIGIIVQYRLDGSLL